MEKANNFKCIKGSFETGKPAQITFYSDVCGWRVEDFVYELNYLENQVHPSEIQILINSAGGDCLAGITAFGAIRNLSTKTKCINMGLAASMASIIWAAGDEGYMYDYSMLMIHCPWADNENDPIVQQSVNAFKSQLKTIYMKRFGMDEDQVEKIMDGKKDEDGTWFSASEAVNAGFLPANHIIETSQQIKDSVHNSIAGVKNLGAIKAVMSSVISENQPFIKGAPIENKKPKGELNINTNTNTMNEELKLVCSQLGLAETAKMADVSAKLIELNGVQAKLDKVNTELKTCKAELETVKTQLAGEKTAKDNLQANLDKAQAALKVFEDKEAAEKDAQVNALVEDAVKAGKIAKDAAEQWKAMAKSNFEMVKATLASIPAREKISEQVNNTKEAKAAIEHDTKTEEQKVAETVKALVGDDFHMKKFAE